MIISIFISKYSQINNTVRMKKGPNELASIAVRVELRLLIKKTQRAPTELQLLIFWWWPFFNKKADACLITLLLKVMQLVRANFFSSLVFLFLKRPQCLAQSFKAIKTQVDVCSNCQAHQSWLFLKWNIRGQKAKLWLGVCQNPSGPFFIRRTYSVKWS